MAALGKIRSRGIILISIIGFGLFAFIAEEAFRSCEATRNDQRQQVGEVLGEKVNVNDFQKLVDEYTDVVKVQQGQENLNEQQVNQIKDIVWNTFVQSKLIKDEAYKLGLTVSDGEMERILKEGTNPMLLQTPFLNQQTRRFDVNLLQKFLVDYKAQQKTNPQIAQQYEKLYKYWVFIEKTIRQQLLAQKYQALLAHCFISNPIAAKMSFDDQNVESQIELGAFPYASVSDNKIKITEDDIQKKYDEIKKRFQQYVETRNVKFIDIQVVASSKDRNNIRKQFAEYKKELSNTDNPSDVVRKSSSLLSYNDMLVSKKAFPEDISSKFDSMSVGQVYGPVENKIDNTINLLKLVAKEQLPDSIEYRQIQIVSGTVDKARQTADSIYAALRSGANFEEMAKKYGQTGQAIWLTSSQYELAPTLDRDSRILIKTLNDASLNEIKNLAFTNGNIIVQVLNRKAFINKYKAAVIKKNIDFSKDTYNTEYNKFSSFISSNPTPESLLKNAARNGYKVQTATDISTAQHNLANINSTRDALKWIFDAKEGSISPMYQCGDNDHLLIVVLDKINPIGYRSLKDKSVKDIVKAEVLRDKKADLIISKIKDVKKISQAKTKGAKISTISQVTFAAPVYIAETGAPEPALSGAVAGTAKGSFSKKPIKGNAGVYVFNVNNKTIRPVKFSEKAEELKNAQKEMQYIGNFMNELYIKAKVVDNRYLFF